MADQEVIKHVKRSYKIWFSKEHSFWHKLKEFGLEVFIIVFAVSLSIWLHDRSEHLHEQQEVKSFLIGLKHNLQGDIAEMKKDTASYLQAQKSFIWITSIKHGEVLPDDRFQEILPIYNRIATQPNVGRYEGFKSSGKIETIEDDVLQNGILDLYEREYPNMLLFCSIYNEGKNKLYNYIDQHQRRLTDSTNNINVVLSSPEAQNLCANSISVKTLLNNYKTCLLKSKKIIAAIDKTYPDNR